MMTDFCKNQISAEPQTQRKESRGEDAYLLILRAPRWTLEKMLAGEDFLVTGARGPGTDNLYGHFCL